MLFRSKEKKPHNIRIKNRNPNEPKIKPDTRYSEKQKYRIYKTKIEPNKLDKIKIDEEDDIVAKIREAFDKERKDTKSPLVEVAPNPYIEPPKEHIENNDMEEGFNHLRQAKQRQIALLSEVSETTPEGQVALMGSVPERPKGSTPEYPRPQTRLLGKLAQKSIEELLEEHRQNRIIQLTEKNNAKRIQTMFRNKLNEPTPSEISALTTAKPGGASGEDFKNQFVDTYYHPKRGRPKLQERRTREVMDFYKTLKKSNKPDNIKYDPKSFNKDKFDKDFTTYLENLPKSRKQNTIEI